MNAWTSCGGDLSDPPHLKREWEGARLIEQRKESAPSPEKDGTPTEKPEVLKKEMKMKNKTLYALAMAAFALPLFAGTALADKDMDPGKKADWMKKELLLTDDQASRVKTILSETHDKMKELKEQKKERIKAVLNEDQRGKFDKMVKEWKEKCEKCASCEKCAKGDKDHKHDHDHDDKD